ncbi:glycosyltransferase [Staphylococcus saprophyticus]|uniref:glycosyltransferase n=1 Tax=Staphylococcus saprophyticus TaxID=29385 RepID=UPI001888DBDD|nr:glycosyltransferase [Staphylococcus saprophyticus]MBF2779555.1 glycosyltransferase [Staphylococcus saprophyticus]
MKRNIYMIIHEINEKKGGVTGICMNRTNLFNTKNYNSDVLTFDFKPNYKEIENKMKEIGKLNINSSIINMYDFFSTHNKKINSSIRINNDEDIIKYISNNYHNTFKEENINLDEYVLHTQTKNYLKLVSGANYIELDFSDFTLYRVKISNPENDERKEKYFSKDGFCYLYKYKKLSNNKTQSIYLIYKNYNFHFENEVGLENYFLNLLIFSSNQAGEEPVFIIDGQGSLRRAQNLSKKNCKVYFVIHTNHLLKPYTSDSKFVLQKETVFKNIDQIDGLVVLTERQKKDIVNVYGKENKFFVIPNYIQKPKINKIPKNKNEIIIVSRLAKGKRIDKAIKIFSRVIKQVPSAKLKIYGDGNEKKNLQALINKLKLDDNVFLMGHTNEVMKKFSEANINIMTSETEAFPSIIIEALLCRTPTVSLDINYGPSDIINSNNGGIVVQNEDDMTNVLIDLLKNPRKITKMGKNGRKNIITNYSHKNILEKWEVMFET